MLYQVFTEFAGTLGAVSDFGGSTEEGDSREGEAPAEPCISQDHRLGSHLYNQTRLHPERLSEIPACG